MMLFCGRHYWLWCSCDGDVVAEEIGGVLCCEFVVVAGVKDLLWCAVVAEEIDYVVVLLLMLLWRMQKLVRSVRGVLV